MIHRDYIAFADEHVEPILNEEKNLTVRYDWEGVDSHQVLLVDGDREAFAEAEIVFTTEMTIEQFVSSDFDGHRNYESPAEMVDHLQQFYPEAELTPDEEITLISFKVWQPKKK